jgi:membrane associated rhomboid family serine protease
MTPWVRRLIFANVAVFLLTMASPQLQLALALIPSAVLTRPWTPFTYMFVHGGFLHILFNMIVLFFFGPRLELRLGARDFLILYFVSGLAAAAASFFTPNAAVVGASGAIYGVMLAFASYWPRDRIWIWGVLPIEARWMVVALTALALWGIVGGTLGRSDGIAHYAHLGGFVGGWIYLKVRERMSGAVRFKRKAEPAPKKGWIADREAKQRWDRIDRDSLHPVNREAYDEIMRKLAASGPSSLTERERAFLDRFVPRD